MTSRGITTALFSALAMGACDWHAPAPRELTAEVAHALFVALTQAQSAALFLSLQTLRDGPSTETGGDTIVVSCPDGGDATLVGGPEHSPPLNIALDYTVTPEDCELTTDDGDRFTIDGHPQRPRPPGIQGRKRFHLGHGIHQGKLVVGAGRHGG